MLESTGDWHTQDNAYGTPGWLAKNGPPTTNGDSNGGATPAAALTPNFGISIPIKRSHSEVPSPPDKGKRRAIEILSDSDDSDDDIPLTNGRGQTNGQLNGSAYTPQPSLPPVSTSRQSSASHATTSRPASTAPGASRPRPSVIDLTLSSDEEDNDSETAVQQPYFRQPDGGSSSRVVAASEPRPAESIRTSDGGWNRTGAPAAPRAYVPQMPSPVNTTNLVGISRARASDWMDEYPETPLDQPNGLY